MSNRKCLIIMKYLELIQNLKEYLIYDLFPPFENVVDILFYFNYNFNMNCPHYSEKIEELLEINNYYIDDLEQFMSITGLIIDFINFLNSL